MDWLNSTVQRIKKFAILFLLLPILTGSIAYVFAKNAVPSYTARAKVELGNFENTGLTDPKFVQERLLSKSYLEELHRNFKTPMKPAQIKEALQVSFGNTPMIALELTGADEKTVRQTLNAVVEGFVSTSNELYEKKYKLLKEKIEAVKSIETTEELIAKQELLYNLELTLTDLRPTKVIEPVAMSQSGTSVSKRVVLGFLLGLMADICILFFFEVFRKTEDRKSVV